MSFDEEHLDEHHECRGAFEMEKRERVKFQTQVARVWAIILWLEREENVFTKGAITPFFREALKDVELPDPERTLVLPAVTHHLPEGRTMIQTFGLKSQSAEDRLDALEKQLGLIWQHLGVIE